MVLILQMYNIRKINFTDIDTFRGHVFLVFLAHALTVCAINYSEPSSQLARAHTIRYNALHCKAKMRNKTDDSQRKSQKKLKQPHDNTGFCWLFFCFSLNFKCMHIIFSFCPFLLCTTVHACCFGQLVAHQQCICIYK